MPGWQWQLCQNWFYSIREVLLFYKNWDQFVFQKTCQLFNPVVSTLTESCQNGVVIALYYKLSHLPDMRWFGFAGLLSLLSHLGVRSCQSSNFPFSSLYQYCQMSVSPRQVGARGIPVGQQAFSGEFHIGVNCKGHWTSWRVPLEYAFCSKKLLQARANATSRFHRRLQGGEICPSCLRFASNWMSYCILMQILPAFKNSRAGLEQL